MFEPFTFGAYLLGLSLSLGGGHLAAWGFLTWARRGATDPFTTDSLGWVTGTLERLFFTLAVAVNLSGVAIAMMAWLGTKLAANWGAPETADVQDIRQLRFSAILGGLVSMLFAFLGGMIISGRYGPTAAGF